jgi:hypothetical protein
MPTNPDEIQSFLDQRKLKYGHDKGSNKFQSGFSTDNYLNATGKNMFTFNIFCEDDGEIVRIIAPNLFTVPPKASTKRKAVVWQTLLQVNWNCRLVTFEYDINDGEIRALYNIPLGDSSLSQQQLMSGVYSMPTALDQYAPDIVRAIEFGIPLEGHRDYANQFEKFIKDWTPASA